MQRRGTRIAILCLLLTAGGLAGFVVWSADRNVHRLDQEHESKSTTIDALLTSIATIASAQQSYTDYGRRDVATLTRVSLLVDRITTDAAGLRATRQSSVSSERLEEFWTALSALMSAESRARERLAGGDDPGAADAILASAREHVNALSSSLRAFGATELQSYRAARSAVALRSRVSLAGLAALWALGLVAFAVSPWRRTAQDETAARAADVQEPPPASVIVETAPVVTETPPSIDLRAAAALAADLSQLTDQNAIPPLLARAANILGARGLIIWMGAGAELFAVAAHGYDEALLARIRPIPRQADNVTAAAWRKGDLLTLPADVDGVGAIVAPLLGPEGCAGVLAAEVSGHRQPDEATQAMAMILASKFAGVLAAWPAASTASEEKPLDRQAAAS
jgi:hypothetical protein